MWRAIHKKTVYAPNPELLEEEKKKTTQELHQEQQKLQKQLELKQHLLQHKEKAQQIAQKIQEAQNTAHTKQRMLVERIGVEIQAAQTLLMQSAQQQISATQEATRIATQISLLETQCAQHQKALANQESITRQFEKRKEHYQTYITQGNQLKTELANLAQKKKLAHDETNPSCPLCEQNLSAARKRFLKQKFEEQERFLTYRLGKLSTLIQKLKALLIAQHETIKTAQKTAETIAAIQAQLDQYAQTAASVAHTRAALEKQLTQQRAHEQKITQQLTREQKIVATLEQEGHKVLLKNEEYAELMQKIQMLETAIINMAYDEQKYTQLTGKLQLFESQAQEQESLQKERALQEQRKQEVSQLVLALKKIKQEIEDLDKKLRPFVELAMLEKKLIQQEQNLAQKIATLGAQKDQLLHKKGSLESQHLALEKLKKEATEHQTMLAKTDELIGDYQAIAQAISKDGIQALLIEEAIPEIEQAANDILGKLTNNQAHISIESLKDLKKGGTRETLDINISDTAGIRSYELFSGGEAFRIDFALRIAISKLLARRAGTSLQTLIIDEGFGSQDEEGLAQVMNAIYAIQDDFSKIIVVSHLYAMKDQFPVHMMVEKGPNGSKVTVLEQG